MIALSITEHRFSTFKPLTDYSFAKDIILLPVLLAELSKLIPHYVMAFTFKNNTYQLSALAGIDNKRHAYLNHDGGWLCKYVPAVLRGYPFSLAKQGEQHVFCIEDSHLFPENTPEAEPIFTAEGKLAEIPVKTLNFLKECEKNRILTQKAVNSLFQADLVSPYELIISQENGKNPVRMTGLYRVDEAKMSALDSLSFAGLRKTGAIALAYAQLFSQAQVNQITDRLNYLAELKTADIGDMYELFGSDDIIKFEN